MLSTLTAVACPLCASVRVPVAPVDVKYIVSEVIAIETPEALLHPKLKQVPIGYATEAFAGIVNVLLAPV